MNTMRFEVLRVGTDVSPVELKLTPPQSKAKSTGRQRKLQPWQESYIARAVRIRRKMTNKAMAKRFDIHPNTVKTYANREHKRSSSK
jgi:hypothetical protein